MCRVWICKLYKRVATVEASVQTPCEMELEEFIEILYVSVFCLYFFVIYRNFVEEEVNSSPVLGVVSSSLGFLTAHRLGRRSRESVRIVSTRRHRDVAAF